MIKTNAPVWWRGFDNIHRLASTFHVVEIEADGTLAIVSHHRLLKHANRVCDQHPGTGIIKAPIPIRFNSGGRFSIQYEVVYDPDPDIVRDELDVDDLFWEG